MRCIHCHTDNKLRDRRAHNYHCSKCGHSFAFEPTTRAEGGITDRLFSTVIQDVSARQTLYFTENQFFFALERKILAKRDGSIIPAALGQAILAVVFVHLTRGSLPAFPFFRTPDVYVYAVILVWILHSKDLSYFAGLRMAQIILNFVFGLLLVVCTFAVSPSFGDPLVNLLLAGLCVYLGFRAFKTRTSYNPCRTSADTTSLLRRFVDVHGGGDFFLPPIRQRPQPASSSPSSLLHADVVSYSFDRVLFCEKESMVQFLIANHFHFEHNCAVLTLDGYPASVYATAIQMLKNNPSLKVYCVHDCSLNGMLFLSKLRASQPWLEDANLEVCDLGLMPRQVITHPRRFFASRLISKAKKTASILDLPISVVSYLQPEELKWLLAGYYVELESILPQRLLRYLVQGMSEMNTPSQVGSDVSFLLGNSAVYMAIDSFG